MSRRAHKSILERIFEQEHSCKNVEECGCPLGTEEYFGKNILAKRL